MVTPIIHVYYEHHTVRFIFIDIITFMIQGYINLWGEGAPSQYVPIDEDTLTSQIGRHFEIGENKPYLNIRIHKTIFLILYFFWIIIALGKNLVYNWSRTK